LAWLTPGANSYRCPPHEYDDATCFLFWDSLSTLSYSISIKTDGAGMGTLIGYEVRGDCDDPSLPPALMFVSNEDSNDAEEIFKEAAKNSRCATSFWIQLSKQTLKRVNRKVESIFTACAYHGDVDFTVHVTWDQSREDGDMAIFGKPKITAVSPATQENADLEILKVNY